MIVEIIYGQSDVLIYSICIFKMNFRLPLVLDERYSEKVMIERIENSSSSEFSLAFGSVQMVK